MSAKVEEYGSWSSSITSKFLTKGNCKSICELQLRNGSPFWIEQTFPAGVRVLYERRVDNSIVQWSPDGVSVTNSVHEYGGGSFCVDEAGIFISTKNGVYQIVEPKSLRLLVKNVEGQDYRYADFCLYKNFIFSVQERHNLQAKHEEPENLLVKINVNNGEIVILTRGADFYAAPRVSPNGKFLVWMQWDKPNMPWDKTSIWIAELEPTNCAFLAKPRQLLYDAAYYGPQWALSPEGTNELELYIDGDSTGFWNIYKVDIEAGGLKENICPLKMDLGNALWNLADDRAYAVSDSNYVIALDHTNPVLSHKSRKQSSQFRSIDSLRDAGFTCFAFLTLSKAPNSSDGEKELLYTIASGPKRSLSLVEVDLQNYNVVVIRETRSQSELDLLDISLPQLHTFKSDGFEVDGYFYPPYSSTYRAPECSLPPPVVLTAHPGPTMRTNDALDLKKQYYTTRGFAVFDINYRGSTGRGTSFRNALNSNWGVADAADVTNAAKFLADKGLVNPNQICIVGSSAGGFLVFAALAHPENKIKVGVSVYGVTDLLDLCKCTHKFEAKYNDQLIAPYPEGINVYNERSPINHLDKIKTPVAFLHGSADPVVPCSQSVHCFEALRKNGITTALRIFEGESHGFRSVEAIAQTADITYSFFCHCLEIVSSVDCDIEIFNSKRKA